jgi:hypothetical protein
MRKLELQFADTSGRNRIDYRLLAGGVIFSAGAVAPALAESISPVFSKLGSVLMEILTRNS